MHSKGFLPVIRRRWLLFLVTASLVIGGHLAWVGYGQPQVYVATTSISIDAPAAGSGSLFLRPDFAVDRPETFGETPVLMQALQLLSGERSFASRVFQEPARKEAIKRFNDRFAAEVAAGGGMRLLGEIGDSIGITKAGDGRAIALSASSADPERALAISWAVAEAARVFHQDRCRELVGKTVADLQAQRSQLEKERDLALEDKTEFAKRTGFTNLPRYLEMVEGMILETEAEQSRLRFQQHEIGRRMDERVARNQQGGEAIGTPAESGAAAGGERDSAEGAQKQWSPAELVEEGAEIAFRLDLLKERKASLTRELFQLTEASQEYNRLEERAATAASKIDRIRGQIQDLEWSGLPSLGQVQLHDPGESAKPRTKPGGGAPAIGLAALVALLFAFGVAWVFEVLDTRLQTEEDVRRYLGLPLLGAIPVRKNPLLTGEGGDDETAERFNTIATLVRSTARELGMKSFMVASSVAGEGKSTVSINLAVALTRKGARVVLVDGDLRAPRLHGMLGLPDVPGLPSLLESRVDPVQIAQGVLPPAAQEDSTGVEEALVQTSLENLWVLTGGAGAESPIRLLESDRMHRVLRELVEAADFVIIDTPPLDRVGDALSIASLVDGSIFVVGCGICDQQDVAWSRHLLSNVRANLLGVVLNRFTDRSARRYCSYHGSATTDRRQVEVEA